MMVVVQVRPVEEPFQVLLSYGSYTLDPAKASGNKPGDVNVKMEETEEAPL